MYIPFISTKPNRLEINREYLQSAFVASISIVLMLIGVYADQSLFDWHNLVITPLQLASLPNLLVAPLLHASTAHLVINCITIVVVGTLAGSVYPRSTLRALPLIWFGSGIAAWLIGKPETQHIGADGMTYGVMFFVGVLGILRRDSIAIAISGIAFCFYTSMIVTLLLHTPNISWQSHVGGAIAGVISGLLIQLINQDIK